MADEGPDLYRVLQVDPAADPDVIQAAYRVLARKHHPDLVGDEQAMKALNAAWEILGDPELRARYDQDRGEATARATKRRAGTALSPKPYLRQHAGPPPGNPSGPVVGFGRYEGWSLGEIVRVDREFLEWLRTVPSGPVVGFGRYEGWSLGEIVRVDREFLEWLRTVPAGRGLKLEIDSVLRQLSARRGAGAPFGRQADPKDSFKS